MIFNDLPAGVGQMNPDDILRHQTLRLQVPGLWTWRSEYHANASGHLLSAFAVLVVAELTQVRRTVWPWILAAVTPLLAAAASAWALPITALICWPLIPVALLCGRRPASVRVAILALGIALTLLWPAVYGVASSPQFPPIMPIDPPRTACR